ncbi:hypothetical protein CEQ90_05775 [Lewinellaceae bacterium SD302]|nr:hypothetical protein CEQ90_05775 [Lewinellaceae bacterium SD302]
MKALTLLLFTCSFCVASPLFAQLTVTGNGQSVTLAEGARLDAAAVIIFNGATVQMTGDNTRLDAVNLSMGTNGQLIISGNNGDVQVEDGLGINNDGVLNVTGSNAFIASDLTIIQNGGMLTMSGLNNQLYSFDDFIIQDGGKFTTRGYVEATEVNWNGEVIFLLAGNAATGDYGQMYSENSPINVNGSIEGQLYNGYEPVTEQTYRLIDLDLSFDQSGFAEVVPGPGWSFDVEQNYADLIFDPNILPVEWLVFTGRWRGTDAVQLDWRTATESGSDYFGVERQNQRGNWDQIGTVAAAGNSMNISDYDFLDNQPGPADPLLYRLRQVDLDGAISYSPIVALERNGLSEPPTLFPNPATNHVFISGFSAGNYSITDAAGRKVSSGMILGTEAQRIELPANLPIGVYSLRSEYGKTITFEVVR